MTRNLGFNRRSQREAGVQSLSLKFKVGVPTPPRSCFPKALMERPSFKKPRSSRPWTAGTRSLQRASRGRREGVLHGATRLTPFDTSRQVMEVQPPSASLWRSGGSDGDRVPTEPRLPKITKRYQRLPVFVLGGNQPRGF